MAAAALKQRALAGMGALARYVPRDDAQLFAFVASPAVRADPWALYRRLHQRGAVLPTRYGVWVVASHEGVTQVLRHATTSVDESLANGLGTVDRSGPFSTLMSRTLLFTDPPDHARLRRLVAHAFTPRTLEALRPRIEAHVEATLHEFRPAGSADLLAELALPLPVAVICELLGVPRAERPRFLPWARQLAPRLDINLFRNPEKERAGDQAAIELTAFLNQLVSDPSRRQPDGLAAALVAVNDDGDRLDHDELVALCALVLVAGFETTMNLIANGLLALLRHPDQLARVRDGGTDPAVAVDELLRYDGPVQLTQRVLLEEIDIDGHHIPDRTLVALLIGAANRDPAVFSEPDRLDVSRDPNPHLAFSSGIHHCLGAGLARLEASMAIPAVLRALPGLRLTAKPKRRDTFVLRGLTALHVTWNP
jgi:unspecific monooxygenase